MKPLPYYEKKFNNVAPKMISYTYRNNSWMLPILDKHLKNTQQCHTNFFRFMCAKLGQIGESGIKEVLSYGIPLYQYVQEHEGKNKQRARLKGA